MLERFWCSLVDQRGEPLSVPKLVVKICLRWTLLSTQRPRVLKGTVGHSSLQQAAPLPLANEALSLPWAWLQFPCPSINVAARPWTTKLQILWFWHLSSNSMLALRELHFSAKYFAPDFQPVWPSSTETSVLAETLLFDLVSRAHA